MMSNALSVVEPQFPYQDKATSATVKELKKFNSDYEWYPTKYSQLDVIANDISSILADFDLVSRHNDTCSLLDVGAGDGRCLAYLRDRVRYGDKPVFNSFKAVEKSSVHIDSYRGKGFDLIGTDFFQTNFISKVCTVAFTNPPYTLFSEWMETLINQLRFKLMYAVLPARWKKDKRIAQALKYRGIESVTVLEEDDFEDGERKARAKVHLVRFCIDDLEGERAERRKERTKAPHCHYKYTLCGSKENDPFQLFIENELGLKQTYSSTTHAFSEFTEKERIKAELENESSPSNALVKSEGVLAGLLDNYERDMQHVLEQYKQIAALDSKLLSELNVEYKVIKQGVQDKLYGLRGVYWSLLFEHLESLSSRLTTKRRLAFLNTISATALDFTKLNAVFVIKDAVEIANTETEKSLIDVYRDLTSEESICRYYVSNQHVFRDTWRHNHGENNSKAMYMLDYRFIYSAYSNFSTDSWKTGLNESAAGFANDLLVVMKLLGYANLRWAFAKEEMSAGKVNHLFGTTPDGEELKLIKIRYYLNGNRHITFHQTALARLNLTASRLLGWIRNKEAYMKETGERHVSDADWSISDNMKIVPSNVIRLVQKR